MLFPLAHLSATKCPLAPAVCLERALALERVPKVAREVGSNLDAGIVQMTAALRVADTSKKEPPFQSDTCARWCARVCRMWVDETLAKLIAVFQQGWGELS